MVEHTRTLDFKIAYAIGLGTMIAAGIFSLSGTAVAEIGSSAVIAFVLAAVVAGLTAASYSEFASIRPPRTAASSSSALPGPVASDAASSGALRTT